MHDGSMATLEEVIDHYIKGGIERPSRSELIKPLKLTAEEKADLLAFLATLNSDLEQHRHSRTSPLTIDIKRICQ